MPGVTEEIERHARVRMSYQDLSGVGKGRRGRRSALRVSISAYSGAHISEVCQLRGEDITQLSGLWFMKFDPAAGALKNINSERAVPLHPAIVASGFLEFVAAQRSGPLFPGLAVDRFGNRGASGTRIISRWVRGLGISACASRPAIHGVIASRH
jgi:integrase